ncbi:MAG TPA: type IV pilus biogenesis/stability protein PilW [Steroidobacteraceae bacterium]|jgi:type IV pilus assembly protein PilF|nr:type IV pilus biogenesis/stability protein PilW [Steroidobacteraceae bacterium]
MKFGGLIGLVVILSSGLAACKSNGLAPGKTPEQAAGVNMQLAIEYMKLGKLGSSREFIERALQQDPSNANVQLTAGLVYERLSEMPKAEKAYATAARLGTRDPNIQNNYAGFLCRTGKAAAGEKLFLEVARNPVYQTPEVALVNAGVCVRSTGDVLDADRYFKRALAIRPNMPEAMLQLGNLAIDRGDGAEALDFVQRYLAVNPPTPEMLWLGFRAQRKLGDATAAAGFARRVQTEFPNSEQAQMMRSGVDR